MDLIATLTDFVLHIDKHLELFVSLHGPWVYALLFVVVFVETGIVVMPFLPGDSLLFIVGALSGSGSMHIGVAISVLAAAAILGDQTNFSIGRRIGPKVFQWETSRLFNRQTFDRAQAFYENHGAITIILARFMPFIRTFAPFVAGVAMMRRSVFTLFNVIGALVWVLALCAAGYFFGNLPFVRDHLETIIWALILVPGLIALVGSRRAPKST